MSLDDYKENLPSADECRQRALLNFAPFLYEDGTQTMPFRLECPHRVKPGETYPLILLFHGAGSLGTDNYLSLFTGGSTPCTSSHSEERLSSSSRNAP